MKWFSRLCKSVILACACVLAVNSYVWAYTTWTCLFSVNNSQWTLTYPYEGSNDLAAFKVPYSCDTSFRGNTGCEPVFVLITIWKWNATTHGFNDMVMQACDPYQENCGSSSNLYGFLICVSSCLGSGREYMAEVSVWNGTCNNPIENTLYGTTTFMFWTE